MKKLLLVILLSLIYSSETAVASPWTIDTLKKVTLTDSILSESSQSELVNFIKSELKYPQIALEYGLAGTIKLQLFLDNRFLAIDQIKIIKLSDDRLRKEVLRVVSLLSEWKFSSSEKQIEYILVSFKFVPNGIGENTYSNGMFTINGNILPKVEKSITH